MIIAARGLQKVRLTGVLNVWRYQNPRLEQELLGIRFKNPIGMSAGLDKNFDLLPIAKRIGLGFEIGGSTTAHVCAGNPRPWFKRLPSEKSIVVNVGLANNGIERNIERIRSYPRKLWRDFPLSVSVAKTNSPQTATDDEAIEDYSPERKALHNRLLREVLDKYKDVPCEAKVFMSGGISGAGKTTILSKMGIDFQNYATVSSDDFKELLAREGAIPHVEGLTPMEASSLVHEESSHLADRLLLNLANQRKNLIYDFTMKSESTTMTRIGTLNNFGYQNKDIRIVFVDVPLSVSKGRAKTRYMVGLNNFDLGGRWVPSFVADKQKAKTNRFNTANAETLVTMGSKLEAEGFPTPIVYDNTDVAKKIDFNEFRKGHRE